MCNYNSIPDCIIYCISNYLDIVYIKRLCECNKKNYLILINKYNKYIKYRNKFIIDNFHKKIINVMGGIDNMINFPILKWNQKFESSTGYIDNIEVNDVSDNIMMGLDYFKRAFICIKVNYNNNTFIITIFQRYTSNKSTWVSSSNNYNFISDKFLYNGNVINRTIEDNIRIIVNRRYNGSIII